MFVLDTSWLYVSRLIRWWLTVRLYPHKIPIRYDDQVFYPDKGLTIVDKSIVFGLHLVILGAAFASIILAFVGATRLIYG